MTAGAVLTICELEDTEYKEKLDEVSGWGNFYLRDIVNMRVVGVVEGTSCPVGDLVLLTCEDKQLYGYDGEELHVVAPSLPKAISDKKIDYPASESYYNGKAFKDMADRLNRREMFLIRQTRNRINAFNLICKMLEWCRTRETKLLMDEMLHSIFFLMKICGVPFSPEEIIQDRTILQQLLSSYPEPFEHLSQLPRRTPFSCVLDMVILMGNSENEAAVKASLQDITRSLDAMFPVSTTICISQNTKNSTRHYGVSMSATGKNQRAIMIAASCFGPWDEYVAGAVMTFLPNEQRMMDTPEFNGAIILPAYIRCEAFDLRTDRIKPPCRSCGEMFGLPTIETHGWPHGNCAEAESVSNLLKHDSEVKRDVRIPSPIGTEEIRQIVQTDVGLKLQEILANSPYRITWTGDFYTASAM
ncbi:uncharacterized protein LOC115409760 [Salarias fasciatus]|uniref:uncharacterized protein LOC115409760 n=1 Tax=Salarias fasciatus TaxID=181472 RepID=UPI001176E787|nr:uncharacterized protein LOC115409760 [Salarias fasciatus]